MAGITFDELWEGLKNENEESREFFQTAEDIARIINRITEERVRQGLTQRDLAKLSGLKQSAIARMESVKSIPRLDTITKVSDALGLEMKLVEKTRIVSVEIAIPQTVKYAWYNQEANSEQYPYQSERQVFAIA